MKGKKRGKEKGKIIKLTPRIRGKRKGKRKGKLIKFEPRIGMIVEKIDKVIAQHGAGMKVALIIGMLECVKMNIIREYED